MGLGALPAHGGPSTSSPGTGRRTAPVSAGSAFKTCFGSMPVTRLCSWIQVVPVGAATVGEGDFPVFDMAVEFLR